LNTGDALGDVDLGSTFLAVLSLVKKLRKSTQENREDDNSEHDDQEHPFAIDFLWRFPHL
jgi:hypothetical protein